MIEHQHVTDGRTDRQTDRQQTDGRTQGHSIYRTIIALQGKTAFLCQPVSRFQPVHTGYDRRLRTKFP